MDLASLVTVFHLDTVYLYRRIPCTEALGKFEMFELLQKCNYKCVCLLNFGME